MSMNYNFNNRNNNRKFNQSIEIARSIMSLIFSLIFLGIFYNTFSSLLLIEDYTGGYFNNFIMIFFVIIGYIFISNITKSILLIVCAVQKKNFYTENGYQIVYYAVEAIVGVIIIGIVAYSAFNIFSQKTYTVFANGWAMFVPYIIVGILGISRIFSGVKKIKLIKKLNNPDPYLENAYIHSQNNEIPNYQHSPVNNTEFDNPIPNTTSSQPYQNTNTYNDTQYQSYNYTQSTTTSNTRVNKFCTECGMRLEPDEKICPVCQTKVK